MLKAENARQKQSTITRFLDFFKLPAESFDTRHHGTVKYTVDHKGYGFIYDPQTHSDIYFHFMDTNGPDLPQRGDKVSFEPISGAQGYRARLVELESKGESERHARCSGCGKLMVPRLIISRGEPATSVCPFCWTTFKAAPGSILDLIVIIGLVAALIWVIGEVVPDPYGGNDILAPASQPHSTS